MPSTEQAKEIAKEITIKAIEKMSIPANATTGPNYEKYAEAICNLYTAIVRAVDEA